MALEVPSWLNQCFVENILRKSEGDNSIQIIDTFSNAATSKGDNYTSDIIRITVKFSRDQGGCKIIEKKSAIVKLLPHESVRRQCVIQSGIFRTEISMMSDTLDKMNKLLGPKHRVSGKCLYMQNENPMLLMIEDLTPLGFRMADRISGLDLAHSILALRVLARFHAASVAVCEKEPKHKELIGIFNNQHPPEARNFFVMNTVIIRALAEEIANWPKMKKYSEKISKLTDHIYQIGVDATKLSEDEFNVINHGDFHVNNILFKYDNDGKPIDPIFVDFQESVYTSPTVDLLYFLNTSPSPDVIENKKNILLNEYLVSLSTTMKQLNCKTQPLTMGELEANLKRRASYGMIVSFTVLPLMLNSKTEARDLNEIVGTGGWINSGLKSENYKKLMIKRIPLYDEWGLLDF